MSKLKALSAVLKSISYNLLIECDYQEAKIAKVLERVIYRVYILIDEESDDFNGLTLDLSNPNNIDIINLKQFVDIWIDNINKLLTSDCVDSDAKTYLSKCKEDLLAL